MTASTKKQVATALPKASYSFAVLAHQDHDGHKYWCDVCERNGHQFDIFDLTSNDWLPADKYDYYLAYPPVRAGIKAVYDERLYILAYALGRRIYPTFDELMVYENKRALSSFLQANEIPHPTTWVFYTKKEALEFAGCCALPIVAKTSAGSTGIGVDIIKSRSSAIAYIQRAFSETGIRCAYGPNFRRVGRISRALHRVATLPGYVKELAIRRHKSRKDAQRGFVIFQEYIPCDFEWRAVRVGDSYFAHKKLPGWGVKISGTSRVDWEKPTESLLDFVEAVCNKRGFLSQAVDVFEPEPDKFLVNELQCFFGSHHPHQMVIDSKPGRFVRHEGTWLFEEGEFNALNSFQLRMRHVVDLIESETLKR